MRVLVMVAIAIAAMAAAGVPSAFAEKRALLVGIDDYSASGFRVAMPPPPDRDWQDLEGARTDVELLRALLVARYGFEPPNIVTLVDRQATRRAILGALENECVLRNAPGDVVVFYFAGHGSQVRNRFSREPDKMDESLVPADSRAGAGDIRDKELRRIFNWAIDCGARLTVILDSCHSASGGRSFDTAIRARGVRPDLRDVADGGDTGPQPESRGALILAAAEDFGFAYESRDPAGESHGAFSWALECALRDAEASEAAIDTFLRTQARLRADMPMQEPVLAGGAEARLSPMFCAHGERRTPAVHLAVEKAESDGTYVVQGGWVNGINVGSRLSAGGVQLEVTSLHGIARSEAREVSSSREAAVRLPSGTLLDVRAWAPPPGRPLRVHIPTSPDDMRAAATALWGEAKRRDIRWVTDPTATCPTHVVRWRDGAWEVIPRGGYSLRYGSADASQLLRLVPDGASLFVQFPATAALRAAIVRSLADRGIELTPDLQAADYVLSGRFENGQLEFAWLHRAINTGADPVLPLRSAWCAAAASETPLTLADALSRLRHVFGWQHLESPPGDALPYRLAVRRTSDHFVVKTVAGEERYELVLRARPGAMPLEVEPRYVYVFVVDSGGRSVLLYPSSGSVENRLPLDGTHPPPEIPLGEQGSFTAAPPYGIDTYFLLATDEALPNPWALEWNGVRGVPPGPTSPLQDLLASGGTTRSLATSPRWSIEKSNLKSVPPRRGDETGGTWQ